MCSRIFENTKFSPKNRKLIKKFQNKTISKMNSTDDKKAFGELKAKYEDWVYPDDFHRAIIAPGPSGPDLTLPGR